jgi:hypothetical protein
MVSAEMHRISVRVMYKLALAYPSCRGSELNMKYTIIDYIVTLLIDNTWRFLDDLIGTRLEVTLRSCSIRHAKQCDFLPDRPWRKSDIP